MHQRYLKVTSSEEAGLVQSASSRALDIPDSTISSCALSTSSLNKGLAPQEASSTSTCIKHITVEQPFKGYKWKAALSATVSVFVLLCVLIGVFRVHRSSEGSSISLFPGTRTLQADLTQNEPSDLHFDELYMSMNWTDAFLKDLKTKTLQGSFQGQANKLQIKSGHHIPFHWVILSCPRQSWGRLITSTLLSGLLNGLQPETITVVWCKHFDPGNIPALFFNLRHSHKLEVLYVPDELPEKVASTYLMALLTPSLRRQPQLPLLITEDDVTFVPDVNAKLSQLLSKAKTKADGKPYILNLYNPPQELIGDLDEVIRKYNKPEPGVQMFPDMQASKAGAVRQTKMSLWYGTQGIMFSPAMAKYSARHFYQFITRKINLTEGFSEGFNSLQDHVLKDFLVRYGCAFKYDPDAPCHAFNVEPSLVQHLGTVSSLFSKNTTKNTQFHLAVDFPMQVAFPAAEKEGLWKRRRNR